MRLASLLVIYLVALVLSVQAQQHANWTRPACALNCMQIYLPQSSCLLTDQLCICTDTTLQANLKKCVSTTCSVRDSLTNKNITSQLCNWPDHDKGPLISRITISFFAVATFFYLTRMIARLPILGGSLGPDDYMITVAYIATIGYNVTCLMMSSVGLGKDLWQIPHTHSDDKVTLLLQIWLAAEKLYILAVWFAKLSILCFYLRIFPDSRFRTIVKMSLAFCAATMFCLFWACLFKCWPISYEWTYWDGEHKGSCSSQNAQGWANAGLNIFGDILVLSLPLRTIWRMSVSMEKKIGIMFMFGAGILITGVSLLRLKTLEMFTYSHNPTWDFAELNYWSTIELNLSIICACLPGFRSFYSRIVYGKIFRKQQDTRNTLRLERYIPKKSQKPSVWSRSVFSELSQATTLGESSEALPKECILVVNDVDIEERNFGSIGSIPPINSWQEGACSVEQWPARSER